MLHPSTLKTGHFPSRYRAPGAHITPRQSANRRSPRATGWRVAPSFRVQLAACDPSWPVLFAGSRRAGIWRAPAEGVTAMGSAAPAASVMGHASWSRRLWPRAPAARRVPSRGIAANRGGQAPSVPTLAVGSGFWQPHAGIQFACALHGRVRAKAIGRRQRDLGAPHDLARAVAIRNGRFERRPVRRADMDADVVSPHGRTLPDLWRDGNHLSVREHLPRHSSPAWLSAFCPRIPGRCDQANHYDLAPVLTECLDCERSARRHLS